MFSSLQDTFKKVFERISGRGKLSEADVLAAAREIKLALLAADVHFSVVKDFVDGVSTRAVGKEVLESITSAQQFTKIVYDELVRVLGQEAAEFDFASSSSPLVVLFVGLQGSGKTTSAARFALHCKNRGRRPLLVPADLARPAAIDQLKILAAQAGVDCFETDPKSNSVKVSIDALEHSKKIGYDTLIIDSAGRLHIDNAMMDEIKEVAAKINPDRIIYVADSMTGQDAVKSAKAFNEALLITGVMLTKLDGDARGGAALSVRAVTGKPIIFVTLGEKLEDMEPFYPDRMASRILDKGDVLTLVEKVSQNIDEDEAKEMGKDILKKGFTLEEFLKQIKMMRKMGPLDKLLGLMPGMGKMAKDVSPDELEREIKRKEAIVLSMTKEERLNPRILNGSRRKRIAKGAGQDVQNVNRFIKEFEAMGQMFKRFKGLKGFKGLTKQAFFC